MLELGSNKIAEIENLDKLPNLTSLFLGKNRITEIKGLQHLTKLRQVSLGVSIILYSPTS
jgi:protein phosphatase 1 regulatory subunit 7